jgi:hypothetical protein
LQLWDGLLDQRQALRRERRRVVGNAGDTATRPRQSVNDVGRKAKLKVGLHRSQIGEAAIFVSSVAEQWHSCGILFKT